MILYYTNNAKPAEFTTRVLLHNIYQNDTNWKICVTKDRQNKLPLSTYVLPFNPTPTYADIFRRILFGLDILGYDHPNEIVYLMEDDVMYTPEHFKLVPPADKIGINKNVAYMCQYGYFRHLEGCCLLSQMFAKASVLRRACEEKLQEIMDGRMKVVEPLAMTEADRAVYPGICTINTKIPNIDIRGDYNATWHFSAADDVQLTNTIDGWPDHAELWDKYGTGANKSVSELVAERG